MTHLNRGEVVMVTIQQVFIFVIDVLDWYNNKKN